MLHGRFSNQRDLVADRLLLLVVVEVARVVADLVHVRRDERDQAVVLLEVHDEVRFGDALTHDGEGGDILRVVDSDAYETPAPAR